MELKENHNGCLSRTFGRINPYRSVLIFCRKQEAPLFSRCQCPLKHRRSCLESRYGKDWTRADVKLLLKQWHWLEELKRDGPSSDVGIVLTGLTFIMCFFFYTPLAMFCCQTDSLGSQPPSFSITINKVALKASFLRTALHHALLVCGTDLSSAWLQLAFHWFNLRRAAELAIKERIVTIRPRIALHSYVKLKSEEMAMSIPSLPHPFRYGRIGLPLSSYKIIESRTSLQALSISRPHLRWRSTVSIAPTPF